jgi:hypothetical protein
MARCRDPRLFVSQNYKVDSTVDAFHQAVEAISPQVERVVHSWPDLPMLPAAASRKWTNGGIEERRAALVRKKCE